MKIYRHIGSLDLRSAPEETLKDAKRIEDVGVLIAKKSQENLIAHIEQRNISSVVYLPEDTGLVTTNGNYKISKVYLESLSHDIVVLVNGEVVIEPIQDPALLNKIHQLYVNGTLYAHETDLGTIGAKSQVNGEVIVVKGDEQLMTSEVILNDVNLLGIEENSAWAVPDLIALDPFDADLFNTRIKGIRIFHDLVTTTGNLKILAPKIKNYAEVQKWIVPDGYQYFEKLTLKPEMIKTLKSKRIFIKGTLKIESDFGALYDAIDAIQCRTLEAPQSVIDQLMDRVEHAKTIKILDPNAVKNMTKMIITSNYLQENRGLSLSNYGSLVFDPSVTAKDVADGIEGIINYGVIRCGENIQGALMTKVKENYGKIKSLEEETPNKNEEGYTVVANLGMLQL